MGRSQGESHGKSQGINAMTMANGSFNRFASSGMGCDCVVVFVFVIPSRSRLLERLPTGFGFGYGLTFPCRIPNTQGTDYRNAAR